MTLRRLLMVFPLLSIPPTERLEFVSTAQREVYLDSISFTSWLAEVQIVSIEIRRADKTGSQNLHGRSSGAKIQADEQSKVEQVTQRIELDRVAHVLPGDDVVCVLLNESADPVRVTGLCIGKAEDK